MKQILLLILVSLAFVVAGQDRIVTLDGDTLNCEITKVNQRNIFFNLRIGGYKTSDKIKRSQVREFGSLKQSAPTSLIVSVPEATVPEVIPGIARPKARMRVGINFGGNYLTGSSSKAEKSMKSIGIPGSVAKKYYDDFKPGYSVGGTVHYMVKRNWGLGLVYNGFANKSSLSAFINNDDGVNKSLANLSEKVYVNYYGFSFYTEQFFRSNPKFKWYSDYSLGVAYYRDEANLFDSPMLLTGSAFAAKLGTGIEYYFLPKVSAGLDFSLFSSRISKMTLNDGVTTVTKKLEKDSYENISRLNLTFGIHFYL